VNSIYPWNVLLFSDLALVPAAFIGRLISALSRWIPAISQPSNLWFGIIDGKEYIPQMHRGGEFDDA